MSVEVTVDIKDIFGETEQGDAVRVWSPGVRDGGTGLINSRPQTKQLVNGKATFTLEPGPVTVQFLPIGAAGKTKFEGVVPDTGPVTLREVIAGDFVYTPPVVQAGVQAIWSARDQSLAVVEDAVEDLDTDVAEFKVKADNALTVATAADGKSTTALSKSTTAESAAGNAVSRVTALEAMGGLSPESPIDGQTANLVSQASTLTRAAISDAIGGFTGYYPLSYFGAVGDGIADDTSALTTAFASGLPLHWGDERKTYRVTAQLSVSASTAVVWASAGATIKFDSATATQHVVSVNLMGNPMVCSGPLTIDADRKSFICLGVYNDHDTAVDLMLDQTRAKNAYRSSTTFVNGDGFHIRGNFTTVTMRRPVVENITMAAGAGVSGSQGITGITIRSYSTTRTPRVVEIEAPYIDGVFDEDFSSNMDQDGIKIFGTSDTRFRISGGTCRNSGVRAVKSQVEWGIVDGLTIIREQARAQGGREIDFQLGGGQVSNIRAIYKGNVPLAVVEFSGATADNANIPNGSLSGLKVVTTGSQRINQVIGVGTRNADASYNVVVNNVELTGVQPEYFLAARGRASSQTGRVILSDVYVSPAVALIASGFGASSEWNSNYILANVVNGGTSVPLWTLNSSQLKIPRVDASNVLGFSLVPTPVGRIATLQTTSQASTSGWNHLRLESGFGKFESTTGTTYYTPPPGKYLITYRRSGGASFDRTINTQRVTITPTDGRYQETVDFSGSTYFRIVGVMSDITITFESMPQ